MTKLNIGGSLFFESDKYETASFNTASFGYTEHATDHWSADRETSVSIDEEMAKQIIAALTEHFWPSTGAQKERKPDDNARLLAAAPDLLDALRSLVDEYEPNMKAFSYNAPRKQFWANARAAIAKATKETP